MYSAFAPVYDQLMDDFPYDELLEIFSSLAPLRGRILEMGCGSGRFTRKVFPRASFYWAMDVSEEMLSLAARRLGNPAGLQLLLDEGEAFPEKLDTVLAAVDVVNYMDEESLSLFFARSHQALVPGGALIFDVSSERKLREKLSDHVFVFERDEFTLIWQNRFSREDKGIYFDLTIFLKEGALYRKETEMHFQRAWQPAEIQSALRAAGFQEIRQLEALDREIFAAYKR
ncbi:MAG TPA: methyltransferase domain-containing protein [Tissierellia bacterium]|nr:methyltransferase domain-containing protein [Tissierellia bacterium]